MPSTLSGEVRCWLSKDGTWLNCELVQSSWKDAQKRHQRSWENILSKLRRILSSLPPDVRRRHCLTVTVNWSSESRYQSLLFSLYHITILLWVYKFKPVHLGIGFFVSSLQKPQQSHERLGLAGRHNGSSLSERGKQKIQTSVVVLRLFLAQSLSLCMILQTRAEITCIRHEPIIKINDQFEMTKRVLDSSKVLEYHSCNVYFLLSAMRPWMILRCCAVLHFVRTNRMCSDQSWSVTARNVWGSNMKKHCNWKPFAFRSMCVTLARASDIGDECADGEDRFTQDNQIQVSVDWLVDHTSSEFSM